MGVKAKALGDILVALKCILVAPGFPSKTGSLHVFKFEKIQKLTGAPHTPVPVPDFLFEIEYFNPANAKFYETKGDRELIYAFHGSRLENFHSIIHNGLHCHLNKVGLRLSLECQQPGSVLVFWALYSCFLCGH